MAGIFIFITSYERMCSTNLKSAIQHFKDDRNFSKIGFDWYFLFHLASGQMASIGAFQMCIPVGRMPGHYKSKTWLYAIHGQCMWMLPCFMHLKILIFISPTEKAHWNLHSWQNCLLNPFLPFSGKVKSFSFVSNPIPFIFCFI